MYRLGIFSCLSAVAIIFTQPAFSYQYFGSKTSYFVNANSDDSPIEVEGCRPALFWNLARHGTRNPGDDDILEMADMLPKIRDQILNSWEEGLGEMEEEEIVRFLEWEFNLSVEDDSLLTMSGKQEHKEMGKRWSKRLPGLLLDKSKTEVRSTSKSRCIESGEAFLAGIFETDFPAIVEDNRLLRFYDYCPKFDDEVEENDETFAESNNFKASEYFQAMITRVNIKTGIPSDLSQVSLMWDMCRFEKAWFPSDSSPWCSLFDEEDLKLLEFGEDLKYYYNDGPAYNITSEMTQPLFADFFAKIDEIRNSEDANVSILNFAHSETLQPFMTALGLYRDQEDLLASDWGTSRQEHKWEVSKIASFATNVGIVVFECDANDGLEEKVKQKGFLEKDISSEEDESLSSEEYKSSEEEESSYEVNYQSSQWKVMLFHQEKPVIQPACGRQICTLDEFLETYSHLSGLDFEYVCNNTFNIEK